MIQELKNSKLTDMELTDIRNTVEYVTSGMQKMYPMGFFSHEKGKLYLIECLRHYAYNIKKYTEEEFIQNFGQKLIREAGVSNGLKKAYGHQTALLFLDVFPDKNIWDMVVIPIGVWTEEVAQEFALYYLEEQLGLTVDTVLSDKLDILRIRTDRNNKKTTLARNIKKFGSIANMILSAYPQLNREVVESVVLSKVQQSKVK